MVQTKGVRLLEDKWLPIGQGPSLVGAYGAEILLAISDVEPSLDDVGFTLRLEAAPLPVATQARLWGRAVLGGGRYARALVAPLMISASTIAPAAPPANERADMRAITSTARTRSSAGASS